MKCLSIQQPWAWAIVTGLKRIENRTWRTPHRGPMLVHAGKTQLRMKDSSLSKWWAEYVPEASFPSVVREAEQHCGMIVGVVELVACTCVDGQAVKLAERWEQNYRDRGERISQQMRFMDIRLGTIYWVVRPIAAFERPLPWKGTLGLFDVPDEAIAGRLEASQYYRKLQEVAA